MKKSLTGWLRKNGENIRKEVRQLASPTFLLILAGCVLLWFGTKLSDNYSTEIPIDIRVNGEKYRVTAHVAGTGSSILATRLSLKENKLHFTYDELLDETAGGYITLGSLARAIDGGLKDLVVSRVSDAPGLVPESESLLPPAK